MGKVKQMVKAYQDRVDVRNNQVLKRKNLSVHVIPDKLAEQTGTETGTDALDFDTRVIVGDWRKVYSST